MKKVAFLLIFICLSISSANATHNRAGYVAYTHISGFTYQVEVTTYTVPDSPADRPMLIVNWGDGQLDTIPRTNGNGNGVVLLPGVKENKYVAQHTYPGLGYYALSMEDPNRNGGILNVPNSINVPFAIQSELRITNTNDFNNSTKPTAIITPYAFAGIPFVRNLAFYDPDADFLSFELTTPRGENGQFIPGYSVPNGVSVNPLNGDFVWDSPQEQGEYNFAMIVSEYRNSEFVGSVTVDFQVTVYPEDFTGIISGTSGWPTNASNDFAITVEPDQSIDLGLVYSDPLQNSVEMEAFGEPFLFGNTASFNSDSSGSHYVANTFNWTPSQEDMRCAPYIVSFRGTSSSNQSTDVSLLIYVHDQATQANPDCFVFAGIDEESDNQTRRASLYPNPIVESVSITFSDEHIFDFTFEVFNASGALVYTQSGSTNRTLILNEHFASGLYFYNVSFSDRKIEQGKVVVQ
ncbi:MAG: T9SS type A sorting domain-containing protein [Flavobacteriales bacterium]|nr:T9SS type A sorting domain-containing protein [Flavobacteriales bacterium]